MRYGYTAAGRADKYSTALQRRRLIEAGVPAGLICSDRMAGIAMVSRPAWRTLEARLRAGDEVAVLSLVRIGCTVSEIVTTVSDLVERGVLVRSLSDAIDPATREGRAKLAVMAALADLEQQRFRRNVKVGVEAARARGVHLGRPRVDSDEVTHKVRTVDRLRETERMTVSEATQKVGWSRSSYYRHRSSQTD